jgi:NitT/TauT family transport system permease protein
MEEAGLGFAVGNFLAVILAVWMAYSEGVARLVYPYAIALKATPVVALAPLLVSLFGLGTTSKIVCAAIVCFFPVIVHSWIYSNRLALRSATFFCVSASILRLHLSLGLLKHLALLVLSVRS